MYFRRRATKWSIARVSVSSRGRQGNGPSYAPDISGRGRFIVFVSEASNLVPGETNRRPDVFVHDRVTGRTVLVSVGERGLPANRGSLMSTISRDGTVVAFSSHASNLVSGDTNSSLDAFSAGFGH